MLVKVIFISLTATLAFSYTLNRPSDDHCEENVRHLDCGYLENPSLKPFRLQTRLGEEENEYFLPYAEIHSENTPLDGNPNYPEAGTPYVPIETKELDNLRQELNLNEDKSEEMLKKVWSTDEVSQLIGLKKLPDHFVAIEEQQNGPNDAPISLLDELPMEQSEVTVEAHDMTDKELEENYRNSYSSNQLSNVEEEDHSESFLINHQLLDEQMETSTQQINVLDENNEETTENVAATTEMEEEIGVTEENEIELTTEMSTEVPEKKNHIKKSSSVGEKILLKI